MRASGPSSALTRPRASSKVYASNLRIFIHVSLGRGIHRAHHANPGERRNLVGRNHDEIGNITFDLLFELGSNQGMAKQNGCSRVENRFFECGLDSLYEALVKARLHLQ